jgi:hypothetical protein
MFVHNAYIPQKRIHFLREGRDTDEGYWYEKEIKLSLSSLCVYQLMKAGTDVGMEGFAFIYL